MNASPHSPHNPTHEFDERSLLVNFGPEPTAASYVRRAIGDWFENYRGFEGYRDDVQLAASELVTNVVLHAGDQGGSLALSADPLRIEVTDASPTLPRSPGHVGSDGGFGLMMLNALAHSWGVQLHDGGKTVWVNFEPDDRHTS